MEKIAILTKQNKKLNYKLLEFLYKNGYKWLTEGNPHKQDDKIYTLLINNLKIKTLTYSKNFDIDGNYYKIYRDENIKNVFKDLKFKLPKTPKWKKYWKEN